MPFDGREENRMHPDLARQISEENSGAANFVSVYAASEIARSAIDAGETGIIPP
jgi:hypothetical protein